LSSRIAAEVTADENVTLLGTLTNSDLAGLWEVCFCMPFWGASPIDFGISESPASTK
jgi:hypothetical protein